MSYYKTPEKGIKWAVIEHSWNTIYLKTIGFFVVFFTYNFHLSFTALYYLSHKKDSWFFVFKLLFRYVSSLLFSGVLKEWKLCCFRCRFDTKVNDWLFFCVFSNSLIIHMVISQSECLILVRCMYLDAQWKSRSRLPRLVQKLMKTLIKTLELATSITMQSIILYRTSKSYSQRGNYNSGKFPRRTQH